MIGFLSLCDQHRGLDAGVTKTFNVYKSSVQNDARGVELDDFIAIWVATEFIFGNHVSYTYKSILPILRSGIPVDCLGGPACPNQIEPGGFDFGFYHSPKPHQRESR